MSYPLLLTIPRLHLNSNNPALLSKNNFHKDDSNKTLEAFISEHKDGIIDQGTNDLRPKAFVEAKKALLLNELSDDFPDFGRLQFGVGLVKSLRSHQGVGDEDSEKLRDEGN